MADLAPARALEAVLRRLRPPRAPLGEPVQLPEPGVLVDRGAQQREHGRDALLPGGRDGWIGAARRRRVAVGREVDAVPLPEHRGGRRVVRARRHRQRAAVLAPGAGGTAPVGDVGLERGERVAEPLDAADVVERELGDQVVLDRPVHVLRLAPAEGGDEAPEVLDQVGRPLGHAREPRLVAERLGEARLAQQELGLPARPQAGRGIAHEREAQPAVLAQDPLALLARVGREAVLGAPQAHVVDRQRGRHLGQPGALERLQRQAGELGQPPQDGRAARLGDRHEEDAQVGQHDGALGDVARERRLHRRRSLTRAGRGVVKIAWPAPGGAAIRG